MEEILWNLFFALARINFVQVNYLTRSVFREWVADTGLAELLGISVVLHVLV